MGNGRTILVTGAGGQLGKELMMLDQHEFQLIGLTRHELDITDQAACFEVLERIHPYAVIHCAAYTSVDKAESDKDEAFRVNRDGTHHLALASEKVGSKFIYISTDYVFDGQGKEPYRESDNTAPRTVYGQSKLAGEQAVIHNHSKAFIVRTSWVYGRYGTNFVKTMLSLAEQNKPLKVVADQVGSPTYTYDLAKFLLQLVATEHYGIYHASNTGTCSWFEFAQAIFAVAKRDVTVIPCTTEEFPRPAPRPAYSVMAHTMLEKHHLGPMPHWRDALAHFMEHNK